ncbi:hypothetical protein B484DRAFT_200064 [Ochromonadaceae sp. CCMP2298]|nr:hypothetical protein B484DRAFT_200064 [Ochromonadaceae sp. CCMP2298]
MEGIDVFALGATLFYMICGRPPWMARNQLDLATKIKNIELTFPETAMDPHLKHLLRQMLTKDYRTRCTLDEIVLDDWVTFEGSDPLFEEEDYASTSYSEFRAYAEADDAEYVDNFHVLIYNPSMIARYVLCAVCTVYCVVCSVFCVLCTVFCVLCSVCCLLCAVYYIS